MKFPIFFIFSLFSVKFSLAVNCGSDDKSPEAKLRRDLFCGGYDLSLRPVKEYNKTTTIKVYMYLKSYDFNEASSTLTVNTWLRSSWNDEFLTWNPSDHDNLKSIDVSSDTIWRGDFSLYNADISYGLGTCHLTSCLLESSGDIYCVEPCSFVSHCNSDYTFWPFDQQNCTMTFGPWMNAGNEVDYISQSSYISHYGAQEHMEWKLVSAKATRKVTTIKSKNPLEEATKIPTINYSFLIERHSAMIIKILTGHIMILIMLNVLVLLVKPDMKERLILIALNVMLHFQVIHQMSWTIPHNGDNTPKATIFLTDSLILTTAIFCESLIVQSLFKTQRQPYDWITSTLKQIKDKNINFLLLHGDQNDQTILIEEPTTAEEVLTTASQDQKPKNNQMWKGIASVIDVIFLTIILITYVLMCLTLLPGNYMNNYSKIEVKG